MYARRYIKPAPGGQPVGKDPSPRIHKAARSPIGSMVEARDTDLQPLARQDLSGWPRGVHAWMRLLPLQEAHASLV